MSPNYSLSELQISRANYTPPQASEVFRNPGNIVKKQLLAIFILLSRCLPSNVWTKWAMWHSMYISCTGWGRVPKARGGGGKERYWCRGISMAQFFFEILHSTKVHTCWHWICSTFQDIKQAKQNNILTLSKTVRFQKGYFYLFHIIDATNLVFEIHTPLPCSRLDYCQIRSRKC